MVGDKAIASAYYEVARLALQVLRNSTLKRIDERDFVVVGTQADGCIARLTAIATGTRVNYPLRASWGVFEIAS